MNIGGEVSFVREYAASALPRREVDGLPGPILLEFGNAWCGHCRRAEPMIEAAFADHASVRHVRIADGSGKRLGRSFGVKLWPTFIFLKDGKEIARLVRPADAAAVRQAFNEVDRP